MYKNAFIVLIMLLSACSGGPSSKTPPTVNLANMTKDEAYQYKSHALLTSFECCSKDFAGYVNDYRHSMGLWPLAMQQNLAKAAQNHSDYLVFNGRGGHGETASLRGYTGAWPIDRALAMGFKSRQLKEVVSTSPYANFDALDALDVLTSSIYHRLNLFSYQDDVIGVGTRHGGSTTAEAYTALIANKVSHALCSGSSFNDDGRFIYNICADVNLKIQVAEYEAARKDLQQEAPAVMVWPAAKFEDFTPAFLDTEKPDPLPAHFIVGNPISISFNQHYFPNPPKIQKFSLKSVAENTQIALLPQFDSAADPEKLLSPWDVVYFPRQRLEWNTVYSATVSYLHQSGRQEDFSWQFKTRNLGYDVKNVLENRVFHVRADDIMGLYFPAQRPEDLTGYALTRLGVDVNVEFIDSETIELFVHGKGEVTITMNGLTATIIVE